MQGDLTDRDQEAESAFGGQRRGGVGGQGPSLGPNLNPAMCIDGPF